MRARTNIQRKKQYTVKLSDFKGVDLNTSPLRVAQNRATAMKNFICDNGVNHKRPGWEEQFRIVNAQGAAQEINGIFPFDEGEHKVLLVHAGDGIYRAVRNGNAWSVKRLDDGTLGILSARSQCFYRGGRAFIAGCGNYLVYGEFDGMYALKEVAEIAYVPTTTIGIGGSGEVQASLDAVNLLTRKRKNTVIGKKVVDEEGRFSYNGGGQYELDGEADNSAVTVHVEGYCYYSVQASGWRETTPIQYELSLVEGDDGYLNIESLVAKGKYNDIDFQHVTGGNVGEYQYIVGSSAAKVIRKEGSLTKIEFYFGVEPLIESTPNITVTYSARTGEGYDEDRVRHCRFGALFGANGADDRLFLAGNPKYPNADIWSEWNDFTYFPDGNTMEVGGGHSAITAYARLSDTTLAVLKEEKAGEPTIFYRTGRERTEADGVTLTQWFPVSAGIAGDGAVNPHAVATLSGDVLTLTREGVHALVLSANVASGERYTRERSRPIYRELSRAPLERAAGIVYRNRYYLALPDSGRCFVADAHYKANFEGSADYNYEWWIWENVPAACFAELEDTLIFGTPAGLVCAFTDGVFTDRTYTVVCGGNLLVHEDGAITYSIDTHPDAYDKVVLEGNVFVVSEDGTRESISGIELYVKDVDTEEQWFTVARDPASDKLLVRAEGGEALIGRFVHVTPVCAEWTTPVMDLGTNAQSKTLLQLTVATEPGVRGALQLAYETRGLCSDISLPLSAKPFSFDDLCFEGFSFIPPFACSYTRRMMVRGFNYIMLRFGSDTDEDCAVSELTLVYKIHQNNRGVK